MLQTSTCLLRPHINTTLKKCEIDENQLDSWKNGTLSSVCPSSSSWFTLQWYDFGTHCPYKELFFFVRFSALYFSYLPFCLQRKMVSSPQFPTSLSTLRTTPNFATCVGSFKSFTKWNFRWVLFSCHSCSQRTPLSIEAQVSSQWY
jgi:hypothetical protein